MEDGQLRLTAFHTENFLGDLGIYCRWMAVDANAESLAVGETDAGREQWAGTQIIDISTGVRTTPTVEHVRPIWFSADGE